MFLLIGGRIDGRWRLPLLATASRGNGGENECVCPHVLHGARIVAWAPTPNGERSEE